MSSLSLSAYGIVTDWSIWVAALIALAVYVHVQKAALRILPDFDINRERLLTYLERLPINLDWLRRAAPSEAVVVEPVGRSSNLLSRMSTPTSIGSATYSKHS